MCFLARDNKFNGKTKLVHFYFPGERGAFRGRGFFVHRSSKGNVMKKNWY